jgi:hypothetical protein
MTPASFNTDPFQNSSVNLGKIEGMEGLITVGLSSRSFCSIAAGDLARPLLDDCLNSVMQPIPSIDIQSFLNFKSRIHLTQVFKQGHQLVNDTAHRDLNIIRQMLAEFLLRHPDPQDQAAMLSDFTNMRSTLSGKYILDLLCSPDLAKVRSGGVLLDVQHFKRSEQITEAVQALVTHPSSDLRLLGMELSYRAPIGHPIRHASNICLSTELPVIQQLVMIEGYEQECIHRPESLPELCQFLASHQLDEEVRAAVVQALSSYFEFALHIGVEGDEHAISFDKKNLSYEQNISWVIGLIREEATSARVRFDLFESLSSAVPDHSQVLSFIQDQLIGERLSVNSQNSFPLKGLMIRNLALMSDEGVKVLLAQVNTLLLDALQFISQPVLQPDFQNLDSDDMGLLIASYRVVAVATHFGDLKALHFVQEHISIQSFQALAQLQIVAPEFQAHVAQITSLAFDCLQEGVMLSPRIFFKVRHILHDQSLLPHTRGRALTLLCEGVQNSGLARLLLAVSEDDLQPDDCVIFQAIDSFNELRPSTKQRAFALCVSQLKNFSKSDEARVLALRFLGSDLNQVVKQFKLLEKLLLNPDESQYLRVEIANFVNAYLLMQISKTGTLPHLHLLLSRLELEDSEAARHCARHIKLSWVSNFRFWDKEVLDELNLPAQQTTAPDFDPTPSPGLRWAFLAIERCECLPATFWYRLCEVALDPNQSEWIRVQAMKITLKFRPEGVLPEPLWTAALQSDSLSLARVAIGDMNRRLPSILR